MQSRGARQSTSVGAAPLLGLLALLLQQDGVDVGQHAAGRDGHARQQLGQLLVVADGQLDVAGHDAGLLVVAGGVAGQLQDLGGQVLQDGGQVDGRARADAGRVLALLQVAGDTADRELEACFVFGGDVVDERGRCWLIQGGWRKSERPQPARVGARERSQKTKKQRAAGHLSAPPGLDTPQTGTQTYTTPDGREKPGRRPPDGSGWRHGETDGAPLSPRRREKFKKKLPGRLTHRPWPIW
jgi:hypothetical protein